MLGKVILEYNSRVLLKYLLVATGKSSPEVRVEMRRDRKEIAAKGSMCGPRRNGKWIIVPIVDIFSEPPPPPPWM